MRNRIPCTRYAVWIALALAILFTASPLWAQAPKRPMRVVYGFDRQYPPFSYEKGGTPAGFDVDILMAALSTYHVDVMMKPMQWEQVQVELSAGSVHVTSGMVKTQKRLLLYDFPDLPNLPLNVKLFTKNTNRVGNVTLLRGMTVSVAKGTVYQRVLEDFGGLNLKLYKSELDALKALYNDDVEVFGGRDRTAMYYLEKLGMKGIHAVGTPLYVTEVYFAVNKEQTKLLKMLNDGLRRIRENGEYDRIFRKWFVQELIPAEISTLVKAAGDAAINAYAPYSHEPVGAAVLTQSGKTYTGANVENAFMGLSASALEIATFKAVSDGETELRAVVTVIPDGTAVAPTASERQILFEFGRGVMAIIEPEKGRFITPMISQLLPFAFERRSEGQKF